ncbi:lipase member N-like [Amblyomma americanum]
MARVCRLVPTIVAFLFLPLCLAVCAHDELNLQARLTPCELIRYFGYPCDVSYATTDDGYVLEVDRIPQGRYRNGACQSKRKRRYPVLLLPALMTASDVWFLNYPSQSAAFLLADDGFDVWAMNSRESGPYSYHRTLQKEDRKYWKWSFDEIGRYDVAAGIDHVLNCTGAPRLTLFGLSQGVTTSLVLLSMRPEYNEKVNLVVAYGPTANISNIGHPLPMLLQTLEQLALDIDPGNEGGYLDLYPLVASVCGYFWNVFCAWIATTCSFISAYQLNETRLPMYASRCPFGTSLQSARHYNQIYQTKDFVMYNHGEEENFVRYSQATPPP